ncbi:MAG: tetratricopeptide repeat protein, partial [Phycisphaerae bacterium]
ANKIDGLMLLARYYESFDDRPAAQSVFIDAGRTVDEIAGSDTELRDRARTAINLGLADFYGRSGDNVAQIDALRTVLSLLKPGDKDAATIRDTRMRLLSVLVQTGDFAAADKEVQQYRKEYPKDIRGMIAEADLITRRATSPESLEQAKVIITKVLEEKPDHVYSLMMRGRIYTAQGKYGDAKEDFLRCKKADPAGYDYAPRVELIRVYEATNQSEPAEAEARELLTELMAIKDVGQSAIQRIAMTLLGVLERSNKSPKAQELVNELIAKYPQEPFWRFQAARLLVNRKEYSTAVDAAKAAVELSAGSDARYISAWLDTMNQAGRSREVVAAASAIKAEGLTPRVRAAIVDAHMRLNDKAAALVELDRGIVQAAKVNVEELNFLIGMTEPLVGVEGVTERMRAAMASPPAEANDVQKLQYSLRLKSALGLSLAQTAEPSRREEGLKMIDEVVSNTEPGSRLRTGALTIKGAALERLGKAQEAADVYTEILKTSPTDEQALNNLAFLLIDRLNQPALGLKYAEQANLFRPGDSNIIDTLGWAYFKNNNAARAEATLQEALRLNGKNVQTLWHLAQVVKSAGRSADVRKYLEQLRDAAKEANNAEYLKRAEDALAGTWPS